MIRTATESDIPRLVEMGRRFREESSYREHIADNPEQLANIFAQIIAGEGILVAEQNGAVVGMLGFVVYPHFFSAEIVAGEIFWWVEPEHRGAGIRLLREAEKRAKARGAVRMQMIAPTDRVAGLYERLDYGFVEATYQKKL